ncbi:hypothetical protein RIF29_41579 [Crotalaria pallida]|uniref:J domain-containing protein n=1 Tax=Crotalaria pallida TaxID=3830 RepID=A0AAN9E5B5_CROPI
MDGNGGGRAEAERWLYTANKLLSARDLHGARSFAIRARESDPRFDATELLIAVIDTLLAGEARISDHLLDWYSILQVLRYTQNIEYIAAQYRRLAILLDPHRNPFAFAAHAFTLVHDAWSVLSNPSKKVVYDNDLRLLTEPPPPPPPAPAPAPPVTGFQFSPPRQNQNQNHNQNQDQNQHHHNQNQGQLYPNQHQQQQQQPQPPQQQQQQQQQQPVPVRRNPRSSNQGRVVAEVERQNQNQSQDNVVEPEPVRVNRTVDSTRTQIVTEAEVEVEIESFWTACPYCYVMYEYPKVYEECTLRCQSCKRGFHAVVVRAPPNLDGNVGGYCSWGFMPLGFSGNFKDLSGGSSEWNPFSPLFPLPGEGGRKVRKGPVTYHDLDACAAFVEKELSETSDDSDDEDWRRYTNTNTKKLRKRGRRAGRRGGFASASGVVRRSTIDRPRRGVQNSAGDGNVANGEAVDGGGGSAPAVPVAARPESSKKAALIGARRRAAANLGKLDLNVEFSNEVEEHAPGAGEGNGRNVNGNATGTGHAEDNIEGIGFFEGLDEFLSSLPILNVVADDKVKAFATFWDQKAWFFVAVLLVLLLLCSFLMQQLDRGFKYTVQSLLLDLKCKSELNKVTLSFISLVIGFLKSDSALTYELWKNGGSLQDEMDLRHICFMQEPWFLRLCWTRPNTRPSFF